MMVALITGASSGIGEALCRELAARGVSVAMLARRTERLAQLAAELPGTLALGCDVSDPASVQAAVAATLQRFGRLDLVVANAGISILGRTTTVPMEEFRRVFNTNVFGVVHVIRATASALSATHGALAVVGSIAGEGFWPNATPYAMSKAAVRGLVKSLRIEAAGRYAVLHVEPGFVASEIRGDHDPVPGWLLLPASKAARITVDAALARRQEIVFPVHAKVFRLLERHAPWISRTLFALRRQVALCRQVRR